MSDKPSGDGPQVSEEPEPPKPKRTKRRAIEVRGGAGSYAHAHAREDRVREIMRMMAQGEYHGLASRYALSERYGVLPNTIKCDASEAHRRLQADPEDIEALRLAHAQFCARMAAKAAAERNFATGLSDIVAALKATELAAKFQGIDLECAPNADSAAPRVEIVLLNEEPEPAK
jgi:hypothetical protein